VATVLKVVRHNKDFLRNAGSLAGTTGITSFFGFAYWIYAARVFSPEAVGYGSAAISTLILIGTIGMLGLDTLLIGELPRGGNRGSLTMAACIAAFVLSLALGVAFCLVSLAFGHRFVEINGTVGRMVIFCLGVAFTGATLVFDAATIGLMRGGLQLSRNAALAIVKMAALPAVALVLHDQLGVGIELSFVISTITSMLPVAFAIRRGRGTLLHRPDWGKLWELRKLALAHNWLNLAINIPLKLIPVLVALVVSPASNGAYYIASMVASFLIMVPMSLSTVLFAVAAATPDKIAEKLRFVLRMSLIIGIPGGLVMGLSGHLILSVFGSSYATLATGPLWILIVAYIPQIPNIVYIAVARAKGRFNQAAIFLTVFAAVQMAALIVGAKVDGLYGLSFGMLAVMVVQAMITTPEVLRTAFGRSAVRSSAAPATAEELRDGFAAQRQQEAGLAAFISLARLNSVGLTAANPAITASNWWPVIEDRTYRSRQQRGIASSDPRPSSGARQYVRSHFPTRSSRHSEFAEHDLP
jgi:O-antigen/teichoic acid export membrane protein